MHLNPIPSLFRVCRRKRWCGVDSCAVYTKPMMADKRSGRKDCPYFTELDQILGKDPAVTPNCTISSLKEASPSVASCDESSSSSAEPRPSEDEDTEPKPASRVKKVRKTQAAEVVQFLQSYVAQQHERHEQQMEEKRKMHREKISILKSLVEGFKKE